jgi:hypothetical protein
MRHPASDFQWEQSRVEPNAEVETGNSPEMLKAFGEMLERGKANSGEYQAERLDTIRKEIELIESGVNPRLNPLNGDDLLAHWREQERLGEEHLAVR